MSSGKLGQPSLAVRGQLKTHDTLIVFIVEAANQAGALGAVS
jgi:hypothetical protein